MNKKLKQILSVILCFCMVFGSVAVSSESIGEFFGSFVSKAAAEDEVVAGICGTDLAWSFNATSQVLTVTGTGTTVENGTFDDIKASVKYIRLPKTVTAIGTSAFEGFTALTEYIVPTQITSIGDNAFKDSGLTSIAVFENVTSISATAFEGCTDTKLYTVSGSFASTYSGNVTVNLSETDFVFELNKDGKSYKVTDTTDKTCTVAVIPTTYNGKPVTGLDDFSLANCKSLATLYISDVVSSVGEDAIYNTGIKNDVTSGLVCASGILFNCLSNSGNITIPENIRLISDYSFSRKEIGDVTFPDSIEYIGKYAFYNCPKMSIAGSVIETRLLPDMDRAYRAIKSPANNVLVYAVPEMPNLYSLGDYAFYGCELLHGFTINDALKEIGDHTFGNNDGRYPVDNNGAMKNTFYVRLDYDSEYIGFFKNLKIQVVFTKDNLTYSFDPDFDGLRLIKVEDLDTRVVLDIPESVSGINVTEVGHSLWKALFVDATGFVFSWAAYEFKITTIIIPDTVDYIGICAFGNLPTVTSVTFGKNIKVISDYAFYNSQFTIDSLPENLEYLGAYSISGATLSDDFEFPESLEYVGYEFLFDSMPSYKKLIDNAPDNEIFYIGKTAFAVKGSLPSTVTVKPGTLYIGNGVLRNRTEVILPEGLLGIDAYGISNVKKINFPESIEYLGEGAIRYMTIDTLYLPNLKFVDINFLQNVTINNLILPDKMDYFVLPSDISGLKTLKIPACERIGCWVDEYYVNTLSAQDIYFGEGTKLIDKWMFYFINNSTRYIHIPSSVTYIEDDCFDDDDSEYIFVCEEGSFAQAYAIKNGFQYMIEDEFSPRNGVEIDYNGEIIYTDKTIVTDITDLFLFDSDDDMITTPSFENESGVIYGTGSEILLANEKICGGFTLVVDGDVNGDGVCDVLDASLTEKAMNKHETFTKYQKAAVYKYNTDTTVSASDYQRMVNKVLS